MGPAGLAKVGKRRKTIMGPVRSTVKDIWSTDSKDSCDSVVHEHGLTSEDAVEEPFLPGIFDQITMAHILPKLNWRDIFKMALVSRTWLHGIRSHHVRDERAFYGSAEKYVVLPCSFRSRAALDFAKTLGFTSPAIALYCMEQDRCYKLPALPPFHAPLPGSYWFRSVALDSKVYIIECYASFEHCTKPAVTGRMMAFDVAGQGGWQPCANLPRTTGNIHCGVVNGKIYAVGGFDYRRLARSRVTSEVYNPKDNTWSSIKRVQYPDLTDPVWALGDKLVVRRKPHNRNLQHDKFDVYDATKDEWTELELSLLVADGWSFNRDFSVKQFEIFTSEGTFYIMDTRKIFIFDSGSGLWKDLHASSFTEIGMGPVNSLVVLPMEILVVNAQIVAMVQVQQKDVDGLRRLLLRSKSRLGEEKEIVWQRTSTDGLSLRGVMGGLLCT